MRLSTSSVSGTASVSATAIRQRLSSSSIDASASIEANAEAVYSANASVREVTTAYAIGYIYGEEWVNVTPESSSWDDKIVSTDIWVTNQASSDQWTDVINSDPANQYVLFGYWQYDYAVGDLFDSDIWTQKQTGSNQWLQQ